MRSFDVKKAFIIEKSERERECKNKIIISAFTHLATQTKPNTKPLRIQMV